MNDITALMATMKAAAENATPGEWCNDDRHGVIADAGLNANFYVASCSGPEYRSNARFIALANPANVLALVEALEAKLPHHNGMMQLSNELVMAKQRIAELESRTVTVKLPDPLMPAQHNSGELFMTPDNVIHGGYLNRDDVLRNLRAAGIQVIEGEGQ